MGKGQERGRSPGAGRRRQVWPPRWRARLATRMSTCRASQRPSPRAAAGSGLSLDFAFLWPLTALSDRRSREGSPPPPTSPRCATFHFPPFPKSSQPQGAPERLPLSSHPASSQPRRPQLAPGRPRRSGRRERSIYLPCLVMIISVWCRWNFSQRGLLHRYTCALPGTSPG